MDRTDVILELVNYSENINNLDAEEIIDYSINTEYTPLEEVFSWWKKYGMVWTELEFINYITNVYGVRISINMILSWGTVFKLDSGLFISWNY